MEHPGRDKEIWDRKKNGARDVDLCDITRNCGYFKELW